MTKEISYKKTPEYKEQRERNNLSVRKSREKKKKEIEALKSRLVSLKEDNQSLENKVVVLKKEIKMLKCMCKEYGILYDWNDANAATKSCAGFFKGRPVPQIEAASHGKPQHEQGHDRFSPK